MLTRVTKNQKRGHVHERIRKKLQGTAERPRLNVYRSLNHIYVQVIDDLSGKTPVSPSTGEGNRQDHRGARQGKGRDQGRVRPRRISVSRAREGLGRRGARSRIEVLT